MELKFSEEIRLRIQIGLQSIIQTNRVLCGSSKDDVVSDLLALFMSVIDSDSELTLLFKECLATVPGTDKLALDLWGE